MKSIGKTRFNEERWNVQTCMMVLFSLRILFTMRVDWKWEYDTATIMTLTMWRCGLWSTQMTFSFLLHCWWCRLPKNAIKRAWSKDEVPIYLYSFHVLNNWKNHIWSKVPNLGTLRDFVYKHLHSFMYLPIEYKEKEEDFLKCTCTIKEGLFKFLYVEKIKQFIDVHYNHQSKFLLSLPIYLNFKSHFFVCFKMHALSLYHISHKYPILFQYFFVVFS